VAPRYPVPITVRRGLAVSLLVEGVAMVISVSSGAVRSR
jgi:hypothetical protein